MAISDKDIDQFLEEYGELAEKSPYLLEDKERFRELSRDDDFKQENNDLYGVIVHAWSEANAHPDKFPEDGFSILLGHIKEFVEKWKTRPVNFWVLDDVVRPKTNEEMEEQADSLGLFDNIKVYPWTTKEEVKEKFDVIRKQKKRLELNQDTWATNFRIKALHDAGWKWREIMDYLSAGGESDQECASRLEAREEELRRQGKTEREIEEITDREFSYDDFDRSLEEQDLSYDKTRMRKKGADDLIRKFWPY